MSVHLLHRTGGGEQTIPADIYYKLLTKTTQILREEYMQKMLQAKGELEKRFVNINFSFLWPSKFTRKINIFKKLNKIYNL